MALIDDKVEFIRRELEKEYGEAHANKGPEKVSFFIPREIVVHKVFIERNIPWVFINQIINDKSSKELQEQHNKQEVIYSAKGFVLVTRTGQDSA